MHKLIWNTLLFFIMLCSSQTLYGKTKKSTTILSFGGYSEVTADDQVNGTSLSISHKRFFTDHWAWFLQLGSGSATGTHEIDDDTSTTIKSSRSSLSGGLKWHYETETMEWLTPYLGGGLSIQSYSYDFEYSGSEIGSTEGTGYGPLFMAGVRLDVASHFLIIPSYQWEQIYIKSESGKTATVTSSGFVLALMIRF